jgi:hypothetical protein
LPFKVELDARTRHLIIINDGADPLVVPGLTTDLFWTWSQPGSGANGTLHSSDSIQFDDLYLAFPVIWFDVPAGGGNCILILHGW